MAFQLDGNIAALRAFVPAHLRDELESVVKEAAALPLPAENRVAFSLADVVRALGEPGAAPGWLMMRKQHAGPLVAWIEGFCALRVSSVWGWPHVWMGDIVTRNGSVAWPVLIALGAEEEPGLRLMVLEQLAEHFDAFEGAWSAQTAALFLRGITEEREVVFGIPAVNVRS